MKRLYRLSTGLIFICLSVILITGCSPGNENEEIETEEESTITETQDDNSELIEAYEELENELASVRAELDELNSEYETLKDEHNSLITEFGNLSKENRELKTKYSELENKYNTVTQTTVDIAEGDIEQAIFDHINEDRRSNRVPELRWSNSLYNWAKEHTDYLVKNKTVELSESPYWQAVIRVAGYATAEQMATGTLKVWKEDASYANHFLNQHADWGAVAVVKSGDVYYITYFSHMQN